MDEKEACAPRRPRPRGFKLEDLQAADWTRFAALMLSPGVPLTHPEPHWTVKKAREAGVEIVGDIELFARTVNAQPEHKRPKVVVITGTNGKSTTTALIGHVCRAAGQDARVGGNIGIGVLDLDDMHGGAVYVLEVSSYQLDLTASLKPDVAVLLNITPDHLDRHGGMDGYVASKRRVLLNQGKGDTAVIGVDDPWCQQICTEITAANRRTIVPISFRPRHRPRVYALQGVLYDGTGERVVEVADLLRAKALPGRHNWQNAAAAYAACRALGIPPAEVADGPAKLPRPRRIAWRRSAASSAACTFVNDSKATNADAARQAMATYPRFFWIAGGVPKAGGIDSLADLFPRVAKAYLIGQAAVPFARTLDGKAPHAIAGDLATAAAQAFADAQAAGGEQIVLLSPACASFDQFPDFEVRGDAFRNLVSRPRPQGKCPSA